MADLAEETRHQQQQDALIALVSQIQEMQVNETANKAPVVEESQEKSTESPTVPQTVDITLLREQNSKIPANSLPKELLSEIFGYHDYLTTLAASWVCHNWRLAALNSPRLWYHIDLAGMPLMKMDNLNSLVSLMVERCAAIPLALNFNWERDGTDAWNIDPPNILNLLEKADSIHNIASNCFNNYKGRMPLLRSLHVYLSDDYPLHNHLQESHNLQHLFVELSGKPLSDISITPKGIRTLHLIGIPDTPMMVLNLLSRLPLLEELVLDGYTDTTERVVDEELEANDEYVWPTLRLVSLKNLTPHFLSQILKYIRIESTTSLHVEPMPIRGELSARHFYRPEDTKSVWLDFSSRTILIQQTSSLTRLIWAEDPAPIHRFIFPSFFRLRTTQSLSIFGMHPRDSIDFSPLKGLKYLAFNYTRCIQGTEGVPLSTTLDQVGSSCTQLNEIRLKLENPPTLGSEEAVVVMEDEADRVVTEFLDAWVQRTGEMFSAMVINDEHKNERWEEIKPAFKTRLGSFEQGRVSILCDMPTFPSLSSPHLMSFS